MPAMRRHARKRFPTPVPADEVFTREEIGHALAAPTPQAGHTAPSAANAPADDGQWTMPSKNYASTRFSALNEITAEQRANADAGVQLLARRQQGPGGGAHRRRQHDVHRHRLSQLRLCARSDQARRAAQMEVRAQAAPASQGVACCDVVNRGGTVDDGKYIFNTLDGQTIALDVKTGKAAVAHAARQHQHGRDHHHGADWSPTAGCTSAIRAARWACAAGSPRSMKCSGKLLWRAYNTGPDADVLIGARFQAASTPSDQGKDLGVKTWPPQAWKIGGGNVWGWITYDAELNTALLRHRQSRARGISEQRPGDNKWTAGIFARDPASGAARWYYQYHPAR